MPYRVLALLLSFHILVAQLGVNIFMLYCCCTKKVEYSFLPKEDPCEIKHVTKTCHVATKTCTVSHSSHKHCQNHLVDYIALDFEAERPSKIELFSFMPWYFADQTQLFQLTRPISTLPDNFSEYVPCKTGTDRLIQYCVKRC